MKGATNCGQKGVTLVELLVVLVIVSIALAAVVPSLGNSYENWLLRSAGRRTVALFRYASDAARREGADLLGYYENHRLVLLRKGSVFKELKIPESITVRPEKPAVAAFLRTGQVVVQEPFVLENNRGRRFVVETGPLPGEVRSRETMNE